MMQSLRPHRVDIAIGCIVAVAISLLINLSLWTALVTTNEWQWNDIVLESGDELFYLTRIREAVDGHRFIGSPTIFESRNQSYPLGSLWENILSLPITLAGWRMKTLSIVADALLPFLIALASWFACLRCIPDRRWRTVTLGMIFLGGNIILWKRPISPQAVSVLPVLWMWLLLNDTRSSLRSLLLRSMLIGLMVYSYPFHWTYCMAVEGVLWISDAIKNRQKRSSLWSALSIGLPFLVIAGTWILQTITASHDPAYAETLSRLGLIERRLPVGPFLQLKLIIVGALLAIVQRTTGNNTHHNILRALLVGGIIVLWLPLVTGREAEFTNHYEKILVFPLALGLVMSLMRLTKKSTLSTSIAMGFCTLFLVTSTWSTLQESFTAFTLSRPSEIERSTLDATLNILRSLPAESVILTENSFASTLTTYTNLYAYMSSTAYMYLAPDSDIVERGRVYNQLVPYEKIWPRGIYGTRYENRMLYARAQCTLLSMIGMAGKHCQEQARHCTECTAFENLPALPTSDVLMLLTKAHVRYVLLKNVPIFLKPSLQTLQEMPDGRILYAFTPPR